MAASASNWQYSQASSREPLTTGEIAEYPVQAVYRAIGYFGFDGGSDSCIALRTVVLQGEGA